MTDLTRRMLAMLKLVYAQANADLTIRQTLTETELKTAGIYLSTSVEYQQKEEDLRAWYKKGIDFIVSSEGSLSGCRNCSMNNDVDNVENSDDDDVGDPVDP